MDDLATMYSHPKFEMGNQAMLLLFEHIKTGHRFVGGSIHLHFNPLKDYIKHAQSVYFIERASAFVKKHSQQETIPFFCGGDFNSGPISSVMSVIHHESILKYENEVVHGASWTIPVTMKTKYQNMY